MRDAREKRCVDDEERVESMPTARAEGIGGRKGGRKGGGRRDRTGRAGTLNVENLNLDWMAYDSKGFARESAVWVVRAT